MRTYVSRLHVVGITTLALLTAGLALFGWSLRPNFAGGYAPVGSATTVQLQPSVPGGVDQEVTESVTRGPDDSATLILDNQTVTGQGGSVPTPAGSWSIYLFNFEGNWRLCTPRSVTFEAGGAVAALTVPAQRVTRPRYASDNPMFVNPIGIEGSGQFYVELCWANGAPIQTKGAYVSANFVPVIGYPFRINLRRQLNLGTGNTANYSIQSISPPTSVTAGGWQWSGQKVSAQEVLSFAAVDTSQTAHDSYEAFLSGIVLGVAGGALVALIQELVAPFRTRKDLRPPEPGG